MLAAGDVPGQAGYVLYMCQLTKSRDGPKVRTVLCLPWVKAGREPQMVAKADCPEHLSLGPPSPCAGRERAWVGTRASDQG